MSNDYDASIAYDGPHADFASLSGSPLWGLSIREIIEAFQKHGWIHHLSKRMPTPYGLGPQINHFTTPDGRDVIWIPSYGMVQDEEFFSQEMERRTFWLLWQAGVKVVLVGGTSGTVDWRDPQGEDTVRPGDFVIPWSFYRENPNAGTLPGTQMTTGFLPRIALMADPFCISLSSDLAERVRKKLVPNPFRRVHDPRTVKVAIHNPQGAGSFETDFEVLTWRILTKLISQEEGFPHVLIFGDCMSPVLARHLGMHLVYYHVPSNWAQGHPATGMQLMESLDHLYLQVLPKTCLNMEIELLQTWDIPTECTCQENLKERPAVYMESITPSSERTESETARLN